MSNDGMPSGWSACKSLKGPVAVSEIATPACRNWYSLSSRWTHITKCRLFLVIEHLGPLNDPRICSASDVGRRLPERLPLELCQGPAMLWAE
jgi:hypothetical protein